MIQYPVRFTLPHAGYQFLQRVSSQNVYHPGADLNYGKGNKDLGESIITPMKSIIEYVSPPPMSINAYNHGYGWFVVLYHPSFGIWSKYAHLNKVVDIPPELNVLPAGIKFAEVGKTGTVSPHLHMEMFGPEMYKIQKTYRRPFGYYPVGKSRFYVQKYYINPLEFMANLIPSDWAKEAWNFLLGKKILSEKSVPRNNITYEQLAVILKNVIDTFIAKK